MISFTDAIVELRPNQPFVCTGNALEGLKFDDSSVSIPTQKQVTDTIKALEAKEKTKESAKTAILEKLGLTADEAAILLG